MRAMYNQPSQYRLMNNADQQFASAVYEPTNDYQDTFVSQHAVYNSFYLSEHNVYENSTPVLRDVINGK